MKRHVALLPLILMLCSALPAQVQEHVKFPSDAAFPDTEQLQISVGRGAHVDASVNVGPNPVHFVARHCAAYAKRTGHLWWKKNTIDIARCNADPSTVFFDSWTHNLLTNAGKDLIAKATGDTATQPAACNYIALTNTAITPAAGDTTLSGEITTNGLSRAQGTFAHTNGTSTYTEVKTFTATATQSAQAAGLFNASSAGSMCFENTFTQVTLNNTDTLTVTWTITLSKLFQMPSEQLAAVLPFPAKPGRASKLAA